MSRQEHWQAVYRDRDLSALSWFRPHLDSSLEEILDAVRAQNRTEESAQILDAGGGASTLVDDLLECGCRGVTVVDLAQSALDAAQLRLGARAAQVRWLCADLLAFPELPMRLHVWHDRAVFHFLCAAEERLRYLEAVRRTLAPGGHCILAIFGPQGPERCSGLPTMRYSSEELALAMGDGFILLRSRLEMHRTPAGAEQQFVLAHFQYQG